MKENKRLNIEKHNFLKASQLLLSLIVGAFDSAVLKSEVTCNVLT